MTDEILIRGADGRWYILRGEELLPYEPAQISAGQKLQAGKELPKGVQPAQISALQQKFQSGKEEKRKTEVIVSTRPPLSVSSPPVTHEEHPLARELEELVERVVKEVESAVVDPVLKKRLRTVVSARLRDVRDASETREIVLRNKRIGGLEINETEAGKIMEVIEQAFGEFQKKWQAEEARRKEEWQKKQTEEAARRREEGKEKEQKELEVRYKKLVGGGTGGPAAETRAKDAVVSPTEADAARRPVSLPPPPAAEEGRGRSTSATLLPRVPATVPPYPLPPMHRELSPQSPISIKREERKITDVRAVPKLVGPLEELSGLTLNDFRRLGKASSAAEKIREKIEIAGQSSPAKRAQAIEAWSRSEVNLRYVNALNTALEQGKAISELVKAQSVSQPDTLTPEEFDAIMELNQKLRS